MRQCCKFDMTTMKKFPFNGFKENKLMLCIQVLANDDLVSSYDATNFAMKMSRTVSTSIFSSICV